MTQPMPRDPHEGIKADAGPEAEAAERDQGSPVARGGQSGTVGSGPQPGDEQPSKAVGGGTAGGDPLGGVTTGADGVEDPVTSDDPVTTDAASADPRQRP